jgi:hypothetical protein
MYDELTHLFPDTKIKENADAFVCNTPRNTYAAVHLLLSGADPSIPIELESSIEGQWYQLLTVPVEENTGVTSRTEQFEGKQNPNVIRRAPFEMYEVMKPINDVVIPDSHVVALRFETFIPEDQIVGSKKVELKLRQNTGEATCQFQINTFSAIVPDSGRHSLKYTNWFDLTKMATFHEIQPNSDAHWSMIDKYASLMKRGRQNTFWITWPYFFSDELVLDQEKLKAYVDRFTQAGLWWIEGAPIAHRPNGDWSSPHLQLRLGNSLSNTKQGLVDLQSVSTQMYDAIRKFGWEERWIQHIADEPTDTNAKEYAAIADILHTTMPGIPLLEATMSQQLVGAVDIWCPQVQEFQANIEFFKERQKNGEQVWTYTCLIPGGKWLNRLIDMERLRQVYFGWAASKYDISGYLHWGLNQYQADPFTQSVVDHPAMPNTTNKLPAGDTHVIYPGDEEPWSGLRFEAHRIGLEDYELLTQLKELDEAKHKSIIQRIFRQYDDYETDVQQYRIARKDLLLALP